MSRKMILYSRIALIGLFGFVLGCGGGTTSDTPVKVEQKETPLKVMLDEVATSGQLGSGAMSIRDALEGMKANGDAKAVELLTDLDDLEKTSDPAMLKKKAAAMAKKL